MLESIAWSCAGGLVLVWLAYPVLIWVIAQVRPTRSTHSHTHRSVTVVLATRGELDEVRLRVLDCLAQEGLDSLSIVVARDPGAPAWATSAFSELDEVTVVEGDSPGGKAAGLNSGVRAAQSDILVFTDTHQRFAADAVARLIQAFDDPSVGAVSGRLELPSATPALVHLYWRFERWLRRTEARVHSTIGVTGAVYALRRDLWTPLPPGLILDDLYVPMRVLLNGRRVEFLETAVAYETRSTTPVEEYHRKVRTLTGVIQLCAWLPQVLVPFRNPVFFQFLIHKILRLFTPYLLLGIFAWLVVLLVAMIGLPWFLLGSVTALALAWFARSRSRLGSILWRILAEGILIQAAVVAATANGFGRRWNVWK